MQIVAQEEAGYTLRAPISAESPCAPWSPAVPELLPSQLSQGQPAPAPLRTQTSTSLPSVTCDACPRRRGWTASQDVSDEVLGSDASNLQSIRWTGGHRGPRGLVPGCCRDGVAHGGEGDTEIVLQTMPEIKSPGLGWLTMKDKRIKTRGAFGVSDAGKLESVVVPVGRVGDGQAGTSGRSPLRCESWVSPPGRQPGCHDCVSAAPRSRQRVGFRRCRQGGS